MARIFLRKIGCLLLVIPLLTIAIQASAEKNFLTSIDQVGNGKYYRVYSLAYGMTMAMSETSTGSNNVFCDTPNENDYMQVWKIVVSASTETQKTITLQNVVSGRWMNRSNNNFHTSSSAQSYTMELTTTGFIIYNGGGFHHQQSGHDVVSYTINADASKWQLEEVTVDQTALAAQQADYNGYVELVNNKANITSSLGEFFTDASCSELKTTYQAYDDNTLTNAMATDGIPQAAIDMAIKVKNNSWETYVTGWNHTEETFRIGSYAPISKESVWRSIVKVGYALSPNSDPTGIYVDAGDIITVYVGNIPNDGSILLRNVQHQSASGDGYTLTTGFNILKMQSAGCLFVDYEVNNTTSTPYKPLSDYPNVTIHIEGGKVNGAFYATRGDTDEDWDKMKQHLFKHYDYLQLRSRKLLFNMTGSLVIGACPEKMVELLDQWDKVVEMEHHIMGLDDEFSGCFNTPMMAVSFTGSGHMYASTYGTYYNENTISDIMRYENLFAGGSLWGPAHEIGHINQAAINIIGQSEVSNNVFSNIAVFQNGHLTSRAEYISTTLQNMADSVYWQDRGIWERTHLYFQLYQFFHVQGYKTDFYPKFFKALRANPCTRVQNTFIDATDDYLKFYKTACQVSGYDLTELFQAYGFFFVPKQTEYTLGSVIKDAFKVGDYGTYYLVVTQKMIEDAIDEVKTMNLPKANIVFIEDRVSAPDATYTGATAGTKKTAFSGYPIGKGDVGQYTDFVSSVAATGYHASYVEDADGDLDVLVNHTGASGAVGFKVYDKDNNLVYLSNTYNFSVSKAIYSKLKGTAFRIVAAGPDGNDQDMEADNDFIEWVVKDNAGNVLKKHFQIVTANQEITDYPTELIAPFVTLPAFTSFTYTGADKDKELVATVNTPFQTSSETQGVYYYVKVRNGYMRQDNTVAKLNSTKVASDLYKWAFYGNPYEGYRLKNLATGQWLCAESVSNSYVPIMKSVDPTYWQIQETTDSNIFLLGLPVPNSNQKANLNDSGAGGHTLILYRDNSSTITVSDKATIEMPTTSINLSSHLSSFSHPSALTVPDDVNIFIVSTTDTYDNTITVQWLDTKVIPAATGVLLYSDGGGEKTLQLGAWVDTEIENLYTGNLLKGTASTPYTVENGDNIYALRNGQTAFAKVGTGVTVPAGKAYLQLGTEASRLLNINFGDTTTGIIGMKDFKNHSLVDTDEKEADADLPLFNISGQRVSRLYKGIVIYHGTKTIQR